MILGSAVFLMEGCHDKIEYGVAHMQVQGWHIDDTANIILRKYDRERGKYIILEVFEPDGRAAVRQWLSENRNKLIPESAAGAVMPACELFISKNEPRDLASMEKISIYSEVDRSGGISISRDQISRLEEYFHKWGRVVELPTDGR